MRPLSNSFGWANRKRYTFEREEKLTAGNHSFAFELRPLTPRQKRVNKLDFRVVSVGIIGPLDERGKVYPKNYERFFFRGEPPKLLDERQAYARDILTRFASIAYRRPVEQRTVDKLLGIVGSLEETNFEESVARAMVAVIASPRFVFRVEGTESKSADSLFPFIDEYALASRLSYFLWSTMPDEELIGLAEHGSLRKNLTKQCRADAA